MKTDPDGNIPKWLNDVFKYMGYISSFGAKTSSTRWFKVVGSAAASATMILVSFGSAVVTLPGVVADIIPYCLSTTAGAEPANKPLNIAASVAGAVQMVVFAADTIASLGYSAFTAFCATAEISTVLDTFSEVQIELRTLSRAANTVITEEERNANLFRSWMTPALERREGLDWLVIRDNHELTTRLDQIDSLYGFNAVTRAAGVALIAARRTARQLNFSVMQRLFSDTILINGFSDIEHQSLLTELFTPLSQESGLVSGTITEEELGTIFSGQEDLFVLQGNHSVSLLRWVSGNFSDGTNTVRLESYEMINHLRTIKRAQGTPYSILEAFRNREGEFMINRYYRL